MAQDASVPGSIDAFFHRVADPGQRSRGRLEPSIEVLLVGGQALVFGSLEKLENLRPGAVPKGGVESQEFRTVGSDEQTEWALPARMHDGATAKSGPGMRKPPAPARLIDPLQDRSVKRRLGSNPIQDPLLTLPQMRDRGSSTKHVYQRRDGVVMSRAERNKVLRFLEAQAGVGDVMELILRDSAYETTLRLRACPPTVPDLTPVGASAIGVVSVLDADVRPQKAEASEMVPSTVVLVVDRAGDRRGPSHSRHLNQSAGGRARLGAG